MDTLKQSIILFDLDGTLTDSEEGIIRSTQYMQEKMGQRIWSAEELHFIVGPPLMQSFTKEFGMAQEMAEKAVAIFRERYATIGLFENSVFPGVVELLQALRKKGKRLAVATSKKEDLAVRILEHFEIADYFEVIGGDRREVGRDNKAKVIDYVLETMQAKKDDVIMIGDRKFDIEGAHAIGIPCIAVEYGYGDRDEFEAQIILQKPRRMWKNCFKRIYKKGVFRLLFFISFYTHRRKTLLPSPPAFRPFPPAPNRDFHPDSGRQYPRDRSDKSS